MFGFCFKQEVIFSIRESMVDGLSWRNCNVTSVCLSVQPSLFLELLPPTACEVRTGLPRLQHSIQNRGSPGRILQWVRCSCGSNKALLSPQWELFKERPGDLWVTRSGTALAWHGHTLELLRTVFAVKPFPWNNFITWEFAHFLYEKYNSICEEKFPVIT